MKNKSITSNIKSKNKSFLKRLFDYIFKNRNNRTLPKENLIKGKLGENTAAKYLKKNGYKIVERNYRCKFGEIDIIALDGDILAFIEIKTRSSRKHIPPEFTVTRNKQNKIKRSASCYLGRHGIEDRDCRFDIAAITIGKGGKSITLYKNAFE